MPTQHPARALYVLIETKLRAMPLVGSWGLCKALFTLSSSYAGCLGLLVCVLCSEVTYCCADSFSYVQTFAYALSWQVTCFSADRFGMSKRLQILLQARTSPDCLSVATLTVPKPPACREPHSHELMCMKQQIATIFMI